MNGPLEVLARFSQKMASANDVMRALVSYDGWFAPGPWATEAFATNMFDRACIWGESSSVSPKHFLAFTQPEIGLALQQRGTNLGLYVGPLRGSTLFSKLPDGIEFHVNPGAPPGHGWFMSGDALQLARLWGRAVRLEQALVDGQEVADRVIDFDAYVYFITATGAIATAVGAGGLENPGMIFTAPDCVEAAQRAVGPGAASLKQGVMSGATLFERFDQLGVDGLLINPAGPGPGRVFTGDMCKMFVKHAEGRIELRRLEALAAEAAERA